MFCSQTAHHSVTENRPQWEDDHWPVYEPSLDQRKWLLCDYFSAAFRSVCFYPFLLSFVSTAAVHGGPSNTPPHLSCPHRGKGAVGWCEGEVYCLDWFIFQIWPQGDSKATDLQPQNLSMSHQEEMTSALATMRVDYDQVRIKDLDLSNNSLLNKRRQRPVVAGADSGGDGDGGEELVMCSNHSKGTFSEEHGKIVIWQRNIDHRAIFLHCSDAHISLTFYPSPNYCTLCSLICCLVL